MDAARFQANLAGLEDLLFGIGTVEQIRGTQTVTITKINAANLPFNETQTLVEVLDASYPDIVIVAAAVEDGSIATVAANTYAFNGVYLGASDTEQTVDLNGDPLTGGELYFDVSAVDPIDHIMKAYNGASWNPAYGVDIASDSLTFTNKILDDATNYIGANHIHYRVRNESGTTIPKGTVITAAGTQPGTDYIEVVPVSNYLTQVAIGITHSSIENNAVGLATNTGVCSDFTDTSAWDEGTILYPNNSGGLTDVEPTTGRYQACAVVTRSHNTQGTLLVEFSDPTYIASTAQSGVTTLVDDLVTDDNSKALTASQGKALNDKMVFAPQRNTIQLSAAGALVENGTAVDVPSGSVVSFATGKNGTNGNVDKLAITDAHAGITLTASSTNYIYFDYLTPSTVTVGTTTTNVAEGFWVKSLETQAQFKTRIGQTADYYDANEGVMYNSSDVAIERVYVGECEADGTGLGGYSI